MTFALTWMADTLRDAGLTVVEVDGWRSRGRGEMGAVQGVLCHHTAGPAKATGTPSLKTIINGRPDLPGPLSQLYLARDGTWHVVAAGRCNHAGRGSWHGVTEGNTHMIGVEAENAGTGNDPWPAVQMDSYTRGVAALLRHGDLAHIMAAGHKEYALPRGRKTDPSFDMDEFRAHLDAHLVAGVDVPARPPASAAPARAMLQKGDRNESVRELQQTLNKQGADPRLSEDRDFGPGTEDAVRAFQASHNLTSDGLVGPATWAALGG